MPAAGVRENRDDAFAAPDAPDYLRDAHIRAFRQDDAGRVAGDDPDVGGRVAARRLLGAARAVRHDLDGVGAGRARVDRGERPEQVRAAADLKDGRSGRHGAVDGPAKQRVAPFVGQHHLVDGLVVNRVFAHRGAQVDGARRRLFAARAQPDPSLERLGLEPAHVPLRSFYSSRRAGSDWAGSTLRRAEPVSSGR
jgi:hypothetical protein